MRYPPIRLALLLAASSLSIFGCAAPPLQRYEASLYLVMKNPSPEQTAAHAEILEELVAEAEEYGRKPPPGICIECALYLERIGRGNEAAVYFEKELRYYPESAAFVAIMTKLLSGEEHLIEEVGDES